MKTEKELKDEIKTALECCETDWCCVCPYYKYECCETILKKDVLTLIAEQEKEIERLKAEFKQLETNADILARGVRDLNHENYELTEKNKQAQIDVMKKLRSRISDKEALIQSYIADCCLTIDDMYTEIDELIKEIENYK